MVDEAAVVVTDCQGSVIQCGNQVLAHIFDLGGVLFQTVHDKPDVFAVQLEELRFHDFCGFLFSENSDIWGVRADHIDHQLNDFFQNVLRGLSVKPDNVIVDVLFDNAPVYFSLRRIASFRFRSAGRGRNEKIGVSINWISFFEVSITTVRYGDFLNSDFRTREMKFLTKIKFGFPSP